MESDLVKSALTFTLGAVCGFIIEDLYRLSTKKISDIFNKSPIKRFFISIKYRHSSINSRFDKNHTKIGDLIFPWVVIQYGPFTASSIKSIYEPSMQIRPKIVDILYEETVNSMNERRTKFESAPDDYDGYKLTGFSVSSRKFGTEEPILKLRFSDTTYFDMISTELKIDQPVFYEGYLTSLRKLFADSKDLTEAPIPEIATFWGIGLSVITKDNRIIICKRANLEEAPHTFWPSVGEGASRQKDSNLENGAPDHNKVALRGVQEELGIPIDSSELTWLSFGVNPINCAYGLIGIVRTKFALDAILSRTSAGASKDSWENKSIEYTEFTPISVANFMKKNPKSWHPFTLITILHALVSEYGIDEVEKSFLNIDIMVSQSMPTKYQISKNKSSYSID